MRFYRHFAGAFGTFWFAVWVLAVVFKKYVQFDERWMYGVPFVCALYAWIRIYGTRDPKQELAELRAYLASMNALPPQQLLQPPQPPPPVMPVLPPHDGPR